MLVRSHARKVSGWKSAFGSPFCIPDLDDELYLHCYIRDAPDICLHDAPKGDLILAKERMEGQSKSGQDSGPSKTYVAHEQLVPSKLHKLTLSVPWALHASDIALHVADEGADCDEQHVVVAPDGNSVELLLVTGGFSQIWIFKWFKHVQALVASGLNTRIWPILSLWFLFCLCRAH